MSCPAAGVHALPGPSVVPLESASDDEADPCANPLSQVRQAARRRTTVHLELAMPVGSSSPMATGQPAVKRVVLGIGMRSRAGIIP